jgi:PAS domain S-box-containing protein
MPASSVITMPEITPSILDGADGISKPLFDQLTRAVFQSTSECVWLLDAEGRTLWTNERLGDLLGESPAQLQARHFFDFTGDEAAQECFRKCNAEQAAQRQEMSFAGRHGKAFADVRLIPVGEGAASPVLAIITDLTCERDSEAAMLVAVEEFERRLREHGACDDDGKQQEPVGYRARLLGLAEQIVAANKELEAFSYSVSHDLREPLRSIDGFSRILLERYSNTLDDKGKDYLNRVRLAAQRMGHLIADMLTLSRIARAEMSPHVVNVTQMVRSICSNLADADPHRSVKVTVGDDLTAVCDPGLLSVVLTNLLDNAWKFTSKRTDATIDVSRTTTSSEEIFRVTDNGAGFDMKYAGKLFRPFQRLHSHEDFTGTGVGLATVQRIIARHGGKTWAEASVGDGARVYFSLPVSLPNPDESSVK